MNTVCRVRASIDHKRTQLLGIQPNRPGQIIDYFVPLIEALGTHQSTKTTNTDSTTARSVSKLLDMFSMIPTSKHRLRMSIYRLALNEFHVLHNRLYPDTAKKNRETKAGTMCVVCYEGVANMVLLPCKHLALCMVCLCVCLHILCGC